MGCLYAVLLGGGLFPDPTLMWRPYPSIIDGIERPPCVLNQGLWRGVLHLIVVSPQPGLRAYGVEVQCEAYAAFEEMIYSVANHGQGGGYDGGVYIKKAETSALLTAYAAVDPGRREARHFSFVGGDYCYEVLSLGEPVVRAFASPEDAYDWGPRLPFRPFADVGSVRSWPSGWRSRGARLA